MTETTTDQAMEASASTVWTTWPAGAIIEETDRDTWVWTGKRMGGQHLIAKTYLSTYDQYRLLDEDQLRNYTYLPHQPAANKTVVDLLVRVASLDQQRLAQVELNQRVHNDWATLNRLLNEYADEKDMCSNYEDKLDDWNASFRTMSLSGRTKEYEVELTVHMTFSTTVTVEATSSDAATSKAEDLDWDDVTTNLDLSDASDVTWEVDDVTSH